MIPKRFLSIFLTAIAVMLLTLTCTKEGGVGPQGIPGIDGPKGADGDRGAGGAKGEQGDRGNTGPTGAKGPKGTRGDAGPRGPAGPPGAQGTAGVGNVIYSGWIRPTDDDLTANGEIELITPKLTQAILNTGEVYLYVRDAASPSQVFPIEGFQVSYYHFGFSVEAGRILIYTDEVFAKGGRNPVGDQLIPRYANLSLQDPDPILDYEYRYVFIPGGTKSSLNMNPADYRRVQQQLDLPEPSFDQAI